MATPAPHRLAISERLPATAAAVDQAASEQLLAWGVPAAQIGELAVMTGRYEYNNPLGKAQDIVGHGLLNSHDPDGHPVVVLPEYAEKGGTRRRGQCAEIASRLMLDVRADWLGRVNAEVTKVGLPVLDAQWAKGNAPTHFSNHCWLDIRPGSAPTQEAIVTDASFRRISVAGGIHEAYLRRKDLEEILVPPHEILQVAEPGQSSAGRCTSVLLGMTADYELGVDLSFFSQAADKNQPVRPMLGAFDASKEHIAYCTTGQDGSIVWKDPDAIVNAAHRAEVSRVLDVFEQAPMSYDRAAYRHYDDDNDQRGW